MMNRGNVKLGVLGWTTVALAACGGGGGDFLVGYAIDAFPGEGQPPAVRLLEAGDGPRRALRYRMTAGSRHETTMTMNLSMSLGMEERSQVIMIPPLVVGMEATVEEAAADRSVLTFGVTGAHAVESLGVDPFVFEAVEAGLGELTGLRGRGTMSSRGFMSLGDFALRPSASADMQQIAQSLRQSFDQMASPLPGDEVGVGARWHTLYRIDSEGMTIYQVATVELVEVTLTGMVVDMHVEQRAPRQELETPAAGIMGVSLELLDMTGEVRGRATWDLDAPFPREAEMSGFSALETRAEGEGEVITTSLEVRMDITIG